MLCISQINFDSTVDTSQAVYLYPSLVYVPYGRLAHTVPTEFVDMTRFIWK